MAGNTLEGIIYQHVVYGAGTILTGKSDISAALIQPGELEEVIARAKPLLEGPDPDQEPARPAPSAPAGRSRRAPPRPATTEADDSSEYDLQQATSDLQQVLNLYNTTVIDGRFIDDLATDPKSVAARLDVELSDSAAAAIEQARNTVVQRFGGSFALSGGKKIVAIAIVAVIAIRAESKPYEVVIDSSGLIKV